MSRDANTARQEKECSDCSKFPFREIGVHSKNQNYQRNRDVKRAQPIVFAIDEDLFYIHPTDFA